MTKNTPPPQSHGVTHMSNLIPLEQVQQHIYLLRGRKVMLDRDLAWLYGVPTKRLNEQVRRNINRFPSDFMLQLTLREMKLFLRSQFATSKAERGGRRYAPLAFTEQGVAMLSSVLNSERAVQVNIQIMRAFVRLRAILASHQKLAKGLKELERQYRGHDVKIQSLFEAIKYLTAPLISGRRRIGFDV